MTKQSFLSACVLSTVSLMVTNTALAVDATSTFCKSGFYVGLQGGRSDTFYKPNDVLAQAANNNNGAAITTTYDSTDNNYDFTSIQAQNTLSGAHTDDKGIGGRLFAGYQFTPYFAAELGYTQFAKTGLAATGTNTTTTVAGNMDTSGNITNSSVVGQSTAITQYSGSVNEHAVDLVAKGTLPLQYGFGVYAKAGMAYIAANRTINSVTGPITATSYSDDGNPVVTNSAGGQYSTIYDKTYQAFRPTYGAGINYSIPDTNMSADISWTRVQGMSAIPNADLWALGLSYKFA